MNEIRILVFKLNGEYFATDIMEVERILGNVGTTKLPDSPSFLEGIIKHEEEVIPVINLYKKFGFNSCSVDSTNKVIVVKKELGKFGVIVDDVNEVTTVNEEVIADIVSMWTGIPVNKILEEEAEKLLNMESILHNRVVGQEEAIKSIATAIRRARAGIKDPSKPIGSFLFLGPTGVGKTELCKTLAKFLFDSEDAMVRIDMSEFMEKHSVSRLVGAPPGYVGYEEGGYLTEAVRRRPYSVILLDEVEKAHADVFNILLQVLDDGRLTDGQGRTVDFRNTVVIMTSNLGSDLIQGSKDESYGEMKALVMSVVSQHFRPEFINRIDETVVFHPLGKDNIRAIASIQLERLAKRMETRGYELVFTEALLDFIGEVGYDPIYGARPLKRAIQQEIENSLAQQVLSGQLLPGKVVTVDYVDGKVQARQ